MGKGSSWYFSLCSGYIPVSVIEDVHSRTLVTCPDWLESASCPPVAPPTSIFLKLAEEYSHLCKKGGTYVVTYVAK